MNVLIEFLSDEPIENVITCLNYQMDKVIYVGYKESVAEQKKNILKFLSKYCKVGEVEFCTVPQYNLEEIVASLSGVIEKEKAENNAVYFDATGGEELILLAFGILVKEYSVAMHSYVVQENRLVDLSLSADYSITHLPEKHRPMNIDMFVELHGAKVNYSMHKSVKNEHDDVFADQVSKIGAIAKKHGGKWHPFVNILKECFKPNDSLQVNVSAESVKQAIVSKNGALTSINEMKTIMLDLEKRGILKQIQITDKRCSFVYSSDLVWNCLRDGGSILELQTYNRMKKEVDDCMVGVHIDWDGVIHQGVGQDVLNEVDVLAIKGVVPILVSCKSGKLGANQALYALYELNTVARRFGGKYAKKILIIAQTMSDIHKERASEMGIEIIKC